MVNCKILYLFLDEGGNFDFSTKGTKFFSLTIVAMIRPFTFYQDMDNYKYSLIETKYNLNKEYFHCTNDNKYIRNHIFDIIAQHKNNFSIHTACFEKEPCLNLYIHQIESKRRENLEINDAFKQNLFYMKTLETLLHQFHIATELQLENIDEIIIITDKIPLNRKREALEKAIKNHLKDTLLYKIPYRILHHDSKAHYGLQIADYCNWAVYREKEIDDSSYCNRIRPFQSEKWYS